MKLMVRKLRIECLVLVVADYSSKRVPMEKQAEILGSCFRQKELHEAMKDILVMTRYKIKPPYNQASGGKTANHHQAMELLKAMEELGKTATLPKICCWK